jgi:hypothetical protein
MSPCEVCSVIDTEISSSGDCGFGKRPLALLCWCGVNVHDDELDEFVGIGQRQEGGSPVDWRTNITGLESLRVHQIEGSTDLVAEKER